MTGTMTPAVPQESVLAVTGDQAPAEVISFGYGHGPAPAGAHVVLDVRGHFRDPHADPELRDLTAADERVIRAVLGTAGVLGLVGVIVAAVHAYRAGPRPGPVTIAVGCAGGRHRSAVIAAEAAWQLELDGVPVTLTHRDTGRPVTGRAASWAPAAPAFAVAADGSPALTAAQAGMLGQVLADAIGYRQLRADMSCSGCAEHPAGLCEDHAADLDRADAYLAVARELGIGVPR